VESNARIKILLCSQQPFVVQGFVTVLRSRPEFKLVSCCESLSEIHDRLKSAQPAIVLLHLTARINLSELQALKSVDSRAQIVLWGDGLAGEFAFQAMQLGVRGILPSTVTIDCLLGSLQNIHKGVLCFEKELVDSVLMQKRVALTERQGQIVSLVAQGLKNKEIAWSLGITEGTVKVYLFKLFKKLGVSDRLDMALYGQRNLFGGQLELEKFREARRHTRRVVDPFGPRSLPPQFGERARLQALN
jgi:DNA-binding NarL/FixJ family response regulator